MMLTATRLLAAGFGSPPFSYRAIIGLEGAGNMMLVLQIAAGIVLAYLIIRFRHSVWTVAVGVLALAAIIAAIVGIGAGVSAVADETSIDWEKVVTFASIIPLFALGGIGAYGLLTLFHITFRTERPRVEGDGCFPVLFFFGILNMLILAAGATAVEAVFPNNPIGRLAQSVDDWSRSAGHKDLGSSLFGTALMAIWPWLIFSLLLGIARIRGRPFADSPRQSLSDDSHSE